MIRPDGDNKPGSIGPPLANTECRLVDPETGEDVGEGERGEIWIRGPQVMKGYLNNPEATAATVDDDGWLHTGDIAVVDGDGFFTIVDRLKELIKYKGFQVAPAELEALIITHPEVADVAVIGVPDEEAGELPKAFVVAAGDELRRRRADRVGRRRGLAAEADPPGRGHRRDPEVAVGEDPAAGAEGPGAGGLARAASAGACGALRGGRRGLELAALRLVGADAAHAEQLADQDLLGAAAVPVVVLGAAEPAHVLDDDVVGPDRDLAVTAGAAVELLGDRADQPDLVAPVGLAEEAGARVRQSLETLHPADDS